MRYSNLLALLSRLFIFRDLLLQLLILSTLDDFIHPVEGSENVNFTTFLAEIVMTYFAKSHYHSIHYNAFLWSHLGSHIQMSCGFPRICSCIFHHSYKCFHRKEYISLSNLFQYSHVCICSGWCHDGIYMFHCSDMSLHWCNLLQEVDFVYQKSDWLKYHGKARNTC